ncbi:hypothetical protein JYG23_07210 [Sedimentibacter sp. zth1]|uniref:DUF6873 family GME fold protein n=1 Tax=Sedimentibacter sp. zth1 TaxID=2816908 RepID=UPI001A938AA7|nr:hypothetical protein [Sedimentibacter sp. zth1]QSX07124.1 hypothetical protein JYG23_07210 [Sedimentibacter sp. zth1]
MNPFLPKLKTRFAFVDYRADKKIFQYIKKYDIEPIKTIKCEELLEPINGHPDMVIHPIDYETIVVAPNVYDYYNDVLKNSGIKVIKGGKTLSRNYPNDIAYNVARIGNYAIHNLKYTDKVLKYYLQKSGVSFVHVNQGYSKCSTACISDYKAITSDITIYNTILSLGIQCIYINPRNIILDGFNYGFIGGSMGLINDKILMLTGKLKNLEDSELLKNFVKDSKIKIEVSTDNNLVDLGTIIVI